MVCIFVRVASPRRGDPNKYTKHMIYNRKKNCFKVSITGALDGSYQVSL